LAIAPSPQYTSAAIGYCGEEDSMASCFTVIYFVILLLLLKSVLGTFECWNEIEGKFGKELFESMLGMV